MLSKLTTNAIRTAGNCYTNNRTGETFKALSNGLGSNMIRCAINTDLQLSDQISNRSGSFFVTDIQQDTAAMHASIFPITHRLTHADTGEIIPAHLGAAPAPSSKRSVSGHTQPQMLVFWIPARYTLRLGEQLRDAGGVHYTVAQVSRSDNSGNIVTMHV